VLANDSGDERDDQQRDGDNTNAREKDGDLRAGDPQPLTQRFVIR